MGLQTKFQAYVNESKMGSFKQLMSHIEEGNVAEVKRIIELDTVRVNQSASAALRKACSLGDIKMIRTIHRANNVEFYPINQSHEDKWKELGSPLMNALQNNHIEAVKYILEDLWDNFKRHKKGTSYTKSGRSKPSAKDNRIYLSCKYELYKIHHKILKDLTLIDKLGLGLVKRVTLEGGLGPHFNSLIETKIKTGEIDKEKYHILIEKLPQDKHSLVDVNKLFILSCIGRDDGKELSNIIDKMQQNSDVSMNDILFISFNTSDMIGPLSTIETDKTRLNKLQKQEYKHKQWYLKEYLIFARKRNCLEAILAKIDLSKIDSSLGVPLFIMMKACFDQRKIKSFMLMQKYMPVEMCLGVYDMKAWNNINFLTKSNLKFTESVINKIIDREQGTKSMLVQLAYESDNDQLSQALYCLLGNYTQCLGSVYGKLQKRDNNSPFGYSKGPGFDDAKIFLELAEDEAKIGNINQILDYYDQLKSGKTERFQQKKVARELDSKDEDDLLDIF